MRRKNSTEATVEKVELKTELDGLKPIEPKDVIDYEVNEEVEPIKEPLEILKIFLKLNDYKWGVNKFLQARKYQILTDGDDHSVFIKNWQVVNDIVYDVIRELYHWKSAYIKRGDYVLFGNVEVRPYKICVCTKYGNVELPAMTVDGKTIYFRWKDLLSPDELEAYRMYNQKSEDFNRLELEKKIMADLISYTQLWTKTLDECAELVDKIKSSLSALWTVKMCKWHDGIMTLEFPIRMGTDNDGIYHPMVLAPLVIDIDFRGKRITMSGNHPHNIGWSPCLGWALSRLKDECFRDKDIYGLVIGMAQFGNSFTSKDCGHNDRDPSKQLIRYLNSWDFDNILNIKEVPFVEIFRTVSFYDVNWFTYNYKAFRDKCQSWDFVKPLLDVLSKENKRWFLRALGYTAEEVNKILEENKLPERIPSYDSSIRADGGFFRDGEEEDEDREDEEYDEDEE